MTLDNDTSKLDSQRRPRLSMGWLAQPLALRHVSAGRAIEILRAKRIPFAPKFHPEEHDFLDIHNGPLGTIKLHEFHGGAEEKGHRLRWIEKSTAPEAR